MGISNHPNGRTHIFQRGSKNPLTSSTLKLIGWSSFISKATATERDPTDLGASDLICHIGCITLAATARVLADDLDYYKLAVRQAGCLGCFDMFCHTTTSNIWGILPHTSYIILHSCRTCWSVQQTRLTRLTWIEVWCSSHQGDVDIFGFFQTVVTGRTRYPTFDVSSIFIIHAPIIPWLKLWQTCTIFLNKVISHCWSEQPYGSCCSSYTWLPNVVYIQQ